MAFTMMLLRCGRIGAHKSVASRFLSSMSGSGVLNHGKHKGKDFEAIYAQDPSYCSWLLKRGAAAGGPYEEFIGFLSSKAREDGQPDPSESHPASNTVYAGHAAVDEAKARAHVSSQDFGGQGDERVGFGRHKDSTYKDAVLSDPDYCRWVKQEVNSEAGAESSPEMKAFAAFLEGVDLPASTSPGRSSRFPQRSSYQSGGSSSSRGSSGGGSYERPGTLIAGAWPVTFGKYNGSTFAEVLQKDTAYCEYVVNLVMQKEEQVSAEMLAFTVYVQHQALSQQE
eukprot:TRINITY_DN63626_c0_g1_i1.p1 TRINITY_DN63626_c0_g1~~TRINITY_DN63626_c0_g1_i1.p1  ORF type:complete len:282 (-),score=44.42 TRINITY_DN63626_c0_g1_i1:98-943(-)